MVLFTNFWNLTKSKPKNQGSFEALELIQFFFLIPAFQTDRSENFEFSCIKSETILSCLKLHPKNFENFGNTERDRMILDKSDISLSDFNQLMDSLCYTTREKLLIPSVSNIGSIFKGGSPVEYFLELQGG